MELFYRKSGSGEPIVILHGLYGSSDNWMTQAKILSEHFEVYLIDQRNHGQSPHADSHTYTDMVNDLHDFLHQQDIKNPILIGHSMGGKVVMRYALEHPNEINKVIVVDIAPKDYSSFSNYGKVTSDHEYILQSLQKINLESLKTRKQITDELKKYFGEEQLIMFLLKNIKRADGGVFQWIMNIDVLQADLQHIMQGFTNVNTSCDHPALFIKGEKSPYIDEDDMFVIRKYFPNAELVTIPKAGHWLHYEQPELLIKTLHYFLL